MSSHLMSEDFSEIQSEDQYPEALNICSVNHWKQNWKCVILTCLICSCLLSVLYCHRQLSSQVNINQEHGSNKNMCWTLIFCAVVLYSLYLMECSYATDNIQLCNRNTENIETIKEKIERMKNSDPIIWWKATCYHYARRKRRTTQYRRGTYFVSTKVYQERVNSFTSSSTFNFACCGVTDISNNLVIDESCGPIVKFSFSKGFAFANMASAIEFEEQRSMFFRELRRYDDYMDIHEGLDLTDYSSFEEEVVAINTRSGRRPWFANPFYYWLYSCCLLSWPFRMILLYNTVHVHFKITKLFGTNYNNLTDSTQQLALLQLYGSYSVDSGDNDETPEWLDIATMSESRGDVNQIASALVPSYSEALLLLDDRRSPMEDTDAQLVQDTSSVEGLDKDICVPSPAPVSRTVSVRRRQTSPSSLSLLRTPRRAIATASAEVGAEEHPFGDVDDPPTYEEALMFPVVEHHRPPSTNVETNTVRPTIATAAGTAQIMNQSQIQFQNELRLPNPNSRTFLSIETSL